MPHPITAPKLLSPGQACDPLALLPGRIWLIDYPINYYGIRCNARCTLLRAQDGSLIVHSPAPLTPAVRDFVGGLSPVSTLLAPGTFHHLYARDWCKAYPEAPLFICPGLERKVPALAFGTLIRDGVAYPWSAELDHLLVPGPWIIREVAFLHRPTRTLILTDVLENFTDATPANGMTRFWLKYVFRMWNRPRAAPEYRIGWLRSRRARATLERILAWDFDRIVMGHGELVHADARAVAHRAWAAYLR